MWVEPMSHQQLCIEVQSSAHCMLHCMLQRTVCYSTLYDVDHGETFKVPITQIFIFSHLNRNVTQVHSAKKFCDLHKTRFVKLFCKTFKFAAILTHHSLYSSLGLQGSCDIQTCSHLEVCRALWLAGITKKCLKDVDCLVLQHCHLSIH